MSSSEKIVKRIGDPNKRKNAHKILAEVGFLKSQYHSCKDKVDELDAILEGERAKQKRVTQTLEQTKEKLSLAQEEIDADFLPEGAQPIPRIQKRDRLRMEVAQLEAALIAQKQSTQRALDSVGVSERVLFETDKNLSLLVDSLEDAELVLATQSELDKERSAQLAKLELKRAQRWEAEQRAAVDARASQVRELQILATNQIATAKLNNSKAVSRMMASNEKTKNVANKIKESMDARLADRAEVVLELKTNVNNVKAQVTTQAEKNRRKIEAARKELEDEKDAILAKGLNPYVEFRRRDLDAEGKARELRMKNAVEQNKVDLAERLIKEEDDRRKEEVDERKAREYEKKHRDEQGRHVIEHRNKEYITSVLAGGKEILDPTGRAARIDPSQVTDVSDYSFGLGKSSRIPAESMKRITEKIRANLNVDKDDLGEYQRLIQGLLTPEEKAKQAAAAAAIASKLGTRSSSAPSSRPSSTTTSGVQQASATTAVDDSDSPIKETKEQIEERRALERKVAELQELANRAGSMPGTDNAAVTINLDGDELKTKKLLKLAEEEALVALDDSIIIDDADSVKYKPYQLSKFEKDSLTRAKERQRARLEDGTEQVAGGRLFKGQSFVPKPSQILFKDFEVGKNYKKNFTLTNASYTFNSFKILELPDEVIDFFIVTFEKPGRMSAGVSCTLEVAFNPQLNQDIRTNLRFFTETGPIEVPLICLIKRCAPRVLTPEIDFGSVVIGQKVHASLKMKNNQALSTPFKIVSLSNVSRKPSIIDPQVLNLGDLGSAETAIAVDGTSAVEATIVNENNDASQLATIEDINVPEVNTRPMSSQDDDQTMEEYGSEAALNLAELSSRVKRVMTSVLRKKKRENPLPLSVNLKDGSINGYDSASVEITCAPLNIGAVEQIFSVIFANVSNSAGTVDEDGVLVTKEQSVTVKVVGEKVPIYLAEEIVDMRCTLFGRIYRKRLEIRNRAKSAYRVNIKIPPPFHHYIEVNPAMLFVQGASSQIVNIKFTPTIDMLKKAAHFSVLNENFKDAARVAIPIEIQVVNQELPAYFILQSDVCASNVSISTSSLDFGKVYVNQQSILEVVVTNISMLPQKLAFTRLRKEISVQPNDGFATLLPNETIKFEVAFSPLSAITYNFDLILQSSFNDTYNIKVIAEGIESPVVFSETAIHMRTTGPGERVLESILVQNKTLKQQCVEIMSPDPRFTWLKISPAVIDLAPGNSCRVEFEFTPPTDLASFDPTQWHEQILNEVNGEISGNNTATITDATVSPSPFEVWEHNSGWIYAKGNYGELQWVKDMENVNGKKKKKERGENDENNEEGNNTEYENDEESNDDLPINVPSREWGVIGNWRIPVCIHQKNRPLTSKSTLQSSLEPKVPFPLFLAIQTVVTLPQLVCDVKYIDFGMMSVGSRQLRQFRIGNMTHQDIFLRASGLNAMGPFTMITPPKRICAGEFRMIIMECLPPRPGLNVEILELASSADIGGHRLRITLRAQGVKPVVALQGLLPPPPSWNSRSGLLDFGNVVGTDVIKQKFTIMNHSTFAVDAVITRSTCMGLPPIRQAELIERTSLGLPIFTYKPEKVRIEEGKSQEIEVIFRPDRGRFQPFREDLNIAVGQTDEVLRVGLFGRAWTRQMIVLPGDPRDEPYAKTRLTIPSAAVEDLAVSNSTYTVRKLAIEAMESVQVPLPPTPPIVLEYPDPFTADANPSTYIEVAAGAAAAAAGKGGGKGAPAPVASAGGRQQSRRLIVSCCKILDGRAGASNGTYEIILGQAAIDSNLFAVSADKGQVNVGSDINVDITCTLPKPRGIGGLSVGSWQTFTADVIVKGGWLPQGDSDEKKIAIVLKAFVSL